MQVNLSPLRAATIYEQLPYKNTGNDEILELSRTLDGTNVLESRFLLDISTADIQSILNTYSIPSQSIQVNLRLFTLELNEVPYTYTIVVDPISGSWTSGTGKLADSEITGGVSWIYRDGDSNSKWLTSSYAPGSTGSYSYFAGGATWYTGSTVSKSFDGSSDADPVIPITSIVQKWLNGTIDNNGLLVKLSVDSDQLVDRYPNFKYYSINTHTVFQPNVEIAWTGSTQYITGSLSTPSQRDIPVVYMYNIEQYVKPNAVYRAYVGCRAKYPKKTYSRIPNFADNMILSSESYYRIKDAMTNDIITDFSEYTRILADGTGSYFDYSTYGLYPERFYNFEVKTKIGGINMVFDNFRFKVVR